MREWLVTNGLGSYASLTNSYENSRKYHGLLVASLNPPTRRWVFVSNLTDKIIIDEKPHYLGDYKNKFSSDYFPSFIYNINGVEIRKTIFMEHQKNTTIIKYQITSNKPTTLIHTPILNSRHIYDTTEKSSIYFKQDIFNNNVSIKPNNIDNSIKIDLKDSDYSPDEKWIDLHYEKERMRNDSWIDNGFIIGEFKKSIKKSSEYFLILSIEDNLSDNASLIFNKECLRKKKLFEQSKLPLKFKKLVLSTDNFLVKKGNDKSIVAGYHWFADWGRDTLISLPGITLVTNRYDEAKQILLSFSKHCRNGLIPNAYMERDSKAVYNTVDASLWFIDRAYQYLKYTNDLEFIKQMWPTLESIISSYVNGTDFNIHMDDDFLISHDEGLTWMDVKLGSYYPTPRSKKAVEIQALWYNALKVLDILAQLNNKKNEYSDLASKVKNSFNEQYKEQYDVIDTRDLSFRPNQLFLVSLDFSMINKTLQSKIVNEVQDNLLTIFGMRTLSPHDPEYKGTYLGDHNRDLAYHNGTVWPWLLGSFITSFAKIKDHDQKWREYAYRNFLSPMFNVFGESWDGSINEIFDGDPPFLPRGCISQAWSVAEILRSWAEDIEYLRPRYEKIILHEISV